MKKYIISLFSVSLLAVSCKDFLHREPVEAISITDQFSTEQGLLEAVNGLYKTFRNTYIGSVSATTYGDLLSGNLAFSPNASINRGTIEAPVSVKKIYDFDDSKLNSDGIMRSFYTNSYQLINNINLVLENVDKVATSDEVKQRVKAEALTLRAYAHFQLMKYFSQNYTYTSDASHLGIIYNTRVQKVGVDYPSRPTIKQNMEQLQADISQAISLFQTDTPAVPAGKKSYFASKTMAQTLAADIALWKNDWQTAYDYTSQALNETTLSLSTEVSVNNWATSEIIFEYAPNSEGDTYIDAMYNYISATSYSEFVASDDLYNLYETSDARLNLFTTKNVPTKVDGSTALQSLPYNFSQKYLATKGLGYRLTELYFIRAEAALMLGNTSQALADINKIRTRAGLSEISSLTINDLLTEKRKEFAFENRYFFDLMRHHQNITRNAGCISDNCSPSYPNDRFIAPIPQTAIELNSNIIQNPSY